MTKIIHKCEKIIIQYDGKKGLETSFLNIFKQTPEGQEWLATDNKIQISIESEIPDFIFKSSIGKIIGLEITRLIVKSTKYHAAKHNVTSRLQTIGNKVCQHFKKNYGIMIDIIIDIYDPRKWSSSREDILSICYDPGFKNLDASDEDK